MNCSTARGLLALNACDALESAEAAPLSEHLAGCESCQGRGDVLTRSFGEALDDVNEPAELPKNGWAQLAKALDAGAAAPAPVLLDVAIALSCSFCRGDVGRSEAVYCASCLAPHHADCFATHGACSVLGCAETRTVQPKDHTPLSPSARSAQVGPRKPRRWRRSRRLGGVAFGIVVASGVAAVFYGTSSGPPGFPSPALEIPRPSPMSPPSDTSSHVPVLREGHVRIQARNGAGGGNRHRIDMLGASKRIRRVSRRTPLSLTGPVSIDERARAYVNGGRIPEDKILVITRIDVRGSAKGDSNGHGELIVEAGGQRIFTLKAEARERTATWTETIEIHPGQERTVFLAVANSSVGEAVFTGHLRDRRPGEVRQRDLPLSATLLDRAKHDNYELATFSFEHGCVIDSTGVVRNDWDLQLSGGLFSVNTVTDDRSRIVDLGPRDWSNVGVLPSLTPHSDFEDVPDDRIPAIAGHMYLVHTKDTETDLYAVFRVESLSPRDRCVITYSLVEPPTPRGIVRNLTVRKEDGALALEWQAPAGAARYRVRRDLQPAIETHTTSMLFTRLPRNAAHRFEVSAVYADDEPSEPVIVTYVPRVPGWTSGTFELECMSEATAFSFAQGKGVEAPGDLVITSSAGGASSLTLSAKNGIAAALPGTYLYIPEDMNAPAYREEHDTDDREPETLSFLVRDGTGGVAAVRIVSWDFPHVRFEYLYRPHGK